MTALRGRVFRAIGRLARWQVGARGQKVIAITGSVGKSTTKEAIGTVLAGPETRVSPRNYNSTLGVPLSVLGIERFPGPTSAWVRLFAGAWVRAKLRLGKAPKVLVLEMGSDRPGNLAETVAIAPPNVSVITGVGESHAMHFGDVAAIADEKATLVDALPTDGTAVLNVDDPLVRAMSGRTKARVIGYGFGEDADVQALAETMHYQRDVSGRDGTTVTVAVGEAQAALFLPNVLGTSPVYAALAAIAVGTTVGMTLDDCVARLSMHVAPPGRMRLFKGIGGALVVDDTYNAAPKSVRAALDTVLGLRRSVGSGSTVAVLGDMLELGEMSDAAHDDVLRHAAETGVARIVAVGDAMAAATARLAVTSPVVAARVRSFADAATAGAHVAEGLAAGDIVLVKGSRKMRMEQAVLALLSDKEANAGQLVKKGD